MVQLSSAPWQQIDFFRGLSSELVSAALEGCELQSTANRDLVFEQGQAANSFVFVVDGLFRLTRQEPDGNKVVLDLVQRGGMVGGLLMSQPDAKYPITLQSVGIGKILKISREQFMNVWLNNPELMRRMQVANIERVHSLQALRGAQRLPLEHKIAWALIQVFRANQLPEVPIQFLRSDVADMIGVAPESVTRTFTSWTDAGIIRQQKNSEMISLKNLSERYFPGGISLY